MVLVARDLARVLGPLEECVGHRHGSPSVTVPGGRHCSGTVRSTVVLTVSHDTWWNGLGKRKTRIPRKHAGFGAIWNYLKR